MRTYEEVVDEINKHVDILVTSYDARVLAIVLAVTARTLFRALIAGGVYTPAQVKEIVTAAFEDVETPADIKPQIGVLGEGPGTIQ